MSVYKYSFHHHVCIQHVCEEWQCVSGTGITDLGKKIDRDRRIYLLEGQKWRDEMNEGRERDIKKMSDSSWWGISKRAGETAEKNKCVCDCGYITFSIITTLFSST